MFLDQQSNSFDRQQGKSTFEACSGLDHILFIAVLVPLMRFEGKTNQMDATPGWLSRLLFVLFCLQAILVTASSYQNHWTPASNMWRFLIWIGVASTLATTAVRLPWQNVLGACGMIAAVGGAGFLAQIESPGFALYVPAADERGFMLFLFAILGARNLGIFILASHKDRPFYGVWLIGWTGMLVALLGVEYSVAWKANMGKLTNGTIGLTALSWGMSGIAAVSLASPWLFSKLEDRPPPSAQSASTWFVVNLLLSGFLAAQRIWWLFLLAMTVHSALIVRLLRTSKTAPAPSLLGGRSNKKP